jgi:hypothetical protein
VPEAPSPPPAATANPGSVLSWAHVKDVTQLPDSVWQRVSAPIRSGYITFAFSGGLQAGGSLEECKGGRLSRNT